MDIINSGIVQILEAPDSQLDTLQLNRELVFSSNQNKLRYKDIVGTIHYMEPAFSKNTAFNKNFGTTADTVCQGNDSRLSDARTPTAHTQDWTTITNTPTTILGYGITNAQPLDDTLTALAGMSTAANRVILVTGTDTFSTGSITNSYVSSSAAIALSKLANINPSGLLGRGSSTTGAIEQLTLSSDNGVSYVWASGLLKISTPQDLRTSASPTFSALSINGNAVWHAGNYMAPVNFFNNMGQPHEAYSDFNNTNDFGFRYIQGATNGPGIPSAQQYYNLNIGLGSNYPFSGINGYAMQFAIPRYRTDAVVSPYACVRFKDAGTWSFWQKIYAGYADSAGNADTVDGYHLDQNVLTTSNPLFNRLSANAFHCFSSISDNTNNAPWYGVGMSNQVLPSATGTAVQLAGYFGLLFRTGAGTVVINQQGSVGIGTSGPSYRLHVDGSAYAHTLYLPQNPVGTIYTGASNPEYSINQYMGDNDLWFIYGESTASNHGRLVLQTNDDGDEPIIFRQKLGGTAYDFATWTRNGSSLVSGLDVHYAFSHRSNIRVINYNQNDWITWATREPDGVSNVYMNLSNLRTISAGVNAGSNTFIDGFANISFSGSSPLALSSLAGTFELPGSAGDAYISLGVPRQFYLSVGQGVGGVKVWHKLTVPNDSVGIGTDNPTNTSLHIIGNWVGGHSTIKVQPSASNNNIAGIGFYNYAGTRKGYINYDSTVGLQIVSEDNLLRLQPPAGNVLIGNQTAAGIPAPVKLSLGGTYSNAAGANPKISVYDDGTNEYGFGVSAMSLDYMVPEIVNSHNWYVGGSKKFSIGNDQVTCKIPLAVEMDLRHVANFSVLNNPQNGWITWAARVTSTATTTISLSNISSISMLPYGTTPADNTPMAVTYGRVQTYGDLHLNADTDGSGSEYVYITAGYGTASSNASNGLSIGQNALSWKNKLIATSNDLYSVANYNYGLSSTYTNLTGFNVQQIYVHRIGSIVFVRFYIYARIADGANGSPAFSLPFTATSDVPLTTTYSLTQSGSTTPQICYITEGTNTMYFDSLAGWSTNQLIRLKGQFFYHTSDSV